ncbi:bolA-like protein 3 [Melanaphis sacchari]|uniref:BolA-like protein 3 n=1 Tax=Melanaphis sacchari TaxID=742174 RepID=A0A2H8TSN0_9HEMI|nr:bolA-like protein 3 [Melanaphis sacchari]
MFQITKRSAKLFSANCIALRKYADSSKVATLKGGENILYSSLQKKFPQAKEIKIKDISGGCGAIFEVFISTTEFKGLSIVKQHQLINEVLKDQIKSMHGIRIHTEIPVENNN